MGKKKITIGIIAILIIGVTIVFTKPEVLQGLLKKATTKPLTTTEKKYETLLLTSEKKLLKINQKISATKDEKEKAALLHTLNYQQIPDKIAYVKKMNNLTPSLEEILKNIKETKLTILEAKKEKYSYNFSKITATLDELEKDIKDIGTKFSKNSSEKTDEQIVLMKKKSLPSLITFRRIFKEQQKQNTTAKKLFEIHKKLTHNIQYNIPSYPDQYPPANDNSDEEIAPLPQRNPVADDQESPAQHVINTAICIVHLAPNLELPTEETIRQEMSKVNQYYNEISYGKVDIRLSTIADPNKIYDGPELPPGPDFITSAVATCDSEINFSIIDQLIIFPAILPGLGGYGSTQTIFTEKGEFLMPTVQIGNFDPNTSSVYNNFNSNLLEHEIGHASFNLAHSSSANCNTVTITPQLNNCDINEYGNIYDIMGSNHYEGHISAWYKFLAGNWLIMEEVRQDGDYQISTLEIAANNTQLLRVPFKNYELCLEYRKPIGYDRENSEERHLEEFWGGGGIPINGGIFMNYCPNREDVFAQLSPLHHHVLLDISPHLNPLIKEDIIPGADLQDMYDVSLRENTIFEDAENGISLSWQAINQNIAEVHIELDETKLD